MGFLFILDRRDGKPLIPVLEAEVPRSDVDGEVASPTQPLPANPALVPQTVGSDDAWGPTPADRDACRERIASLRNQGVFTPPSLGGTLVVPGNVGGVAWGGASHDPQRRLLFVNTNNLPFVVRLIPRDTFDTERSAGRDNRLTGEFASQRGAPFGMYREPFVSPKGLPCLAPPWGSLVAVDVDTGMVRWRVPLGARTIPAHAVGNDDDIVIKGLPSLGGSLVTGGGLLFIAAALRDDTIRAYDTDRGTVLWEAKLPAGGQAAPMSYEIGGKQYVVIAAGGHGKANTTQGDYVIAYALP
jgi:quinoprotein glucose dehydrogenase